MVVKIWKMIFGSELVVFKSVVKYSNRMVSFRILIFLNVNRYNIFSNVVVCEDVVFNL